MLNIFSHLGQRAATFGAAGAAGGVVFTPGALVTGLGYIGFSATGPVAGKFSHANSLAISHPTSCYCKAR